MQQLRRARASTRSWSGCRRRRASKQGTSLEQGAQQVAERAAGGEPAGSSRSSAASSSARSIGADLQRQGHLRDAGLDRSASPSTSRFRFRFAFAIGAIAATFHDVLVTLAFLAFFGYDLSLNVVAALLTITGYSVNDTIVIFDRVRENMRTHAARLARDRSSTTSVNQTLGRTIITAGTTFLSVLALYLFGGEVLEGFAFTMLVGIVSGTYSTIFIASAIAILLSKRAAGPGRRGGRRRAGGRHGRRRRRRRDAARRLSRPRRSSATSRHMSISSPRSWGSSRGLTEFLPISSPRRTCCSARACSAVDEPLGGVFNVMIQLGRSWR